MEFLFVINIRLSSWSAAMVMWSYWYGMVFVIWDMQNKFDLSSNFFFLNCYCNWIPVNENNISWNVVHSLLWYTIREYKLCSFHIFDDSSNINFNVHQMYWNAIFDSKSAGFAFTFQTNSKKKNEHSVYRVSNKYMIRIRQETRHHRIVSIHRYVRCAPHLSHQ